MFALLLNNSQPTMDEIERSLVGNISRCNGYRAVLEAFKAFTTCATNESNKFEPTLPKLQADILEPLVFNGMDVTWYVVPSMAWLKTLQIKHQDAMIVYGIPCLDDLKGTKTVLDVSRVGHSKKEGRGHYEVSANLTITEFIAKLKEITSVSNSCVLMEAIYALETTKTSQYRNARALGDAIKDCFELQVLLLSLGTTISILAAPHCKIMKFLGGDKAVPFKEALSNFHNFSVKSLNIPAFCKEENLLFYRIADRKANGHNVRCGAFLFSMEKKKLNSANASFGSKVRGVKEIEGFGGHLKGVACDDLNLLKEKVGKLSVDKLYKGIMDTFLLEVSMNANNTHNEMTSFFENRAVKKKQISSTQFKDCVVGDLKDCSAPFGRPVPSLQALSCATGQAAFTGDIPFQSHELALALVLSTIAYGKIKDIDASEALEMKGVERFICAKDVPEGCNSIKLMHFKDEHLFAEDMVEYEGDVIGAILAKDEKTARRAAALVKVQYEEMVPVVSLQDAIAKNTIMEAPEVCLDFAKGDINTALENSEKVISGSISTPRQEHFYEETNNILVVPTGEDDEFDIYLPTPSQFLVQTICAAVLMLPCHKLNVYTKRIGCSYGGKFARTVPFAAIVAFASKLVKKPIRAQLTRDEDIKLTGQRGEFIGKYTAGVRDGKLMGAKFEYAKNAGWSTDNSFDIANITLLTSDMCYDFPNFAANAKIYKTNTPSNTAFRGYGSPPAITVTENMMFDICAEMGYDPVEFRRNNFQQVGYVSHYEQVMEESDVTMADCFDDMIEMYKYYEVKAEVDNFNSRHKYKKRGIALIPNKYGIGMPGMYGQGGCLINIYVDGSVMVSVGGVEMGQGLHTKIVQIVSHELGLPLSRIRMAASTNRTIPNPIPTGGSTGADLSGNAARDACLNILKKLAPLKEAQPKAPWEMLVGMAFASKINLSTIGYFGVPGEKFQYDDATGKGRRFWYYTTGATMSVVEVDLLTGQHALLKSAIIMDVGESPNPAIDIANIEAAFIQGYGWLAMEDAQFDSKGLLRSRGHDEYSCPTIADCPQEFDVALLRGRKKIKQILYSSKGVGEPPFNNGAVVFFAIKDALLAAHRANGGKGTINLNTPATPANVMEAIEKIL